MPLNLSNFWQVVYLADTNAYIPLDSLRGPATPIAPQLYAGADLEAWRPELWDRDYNRRYRFNNTRVQRKFCPVFGPVFKLQLFNI